MTSEKELSSGLTRGLVAHKPASKFMAEYHEELEDKVKIYFTVYYFEDKDNILYYLYIVDPLRVELLTPCG